MCSRLLHDGNSQIYRFRAMFWMLKDMMKARPTLRGMYSFSINTRVVQTLMRPFGACTRVWTTLLLIPDLVLPSQLVLSMYLPSQTSPRARPLLSVYFTLSCATIGASISRNQRPDHAVITWAYRAGTLKPIFH